ncbi:hypothetical protein Tco_0277528 [Tanacetum coccineum]
MDRSYENCVLQNKYVIKNGRDVVELVNSFDSLKGISKMEVNGLVRRLLEEEERSWNGGLRKTFDKEKERLKEMKMVGEVSIW